MAHWKKSRGFSLQKVTLKLAFTGKIIGSHCREPVEELLRKAHSGVEGFPTVLHMLFYSQQDALALKLPVMQLQLIFNSSTKKNRMCKRTFVCSLGKGRQCCAASLGKKGKCCCPPATQKLQGTHLLWQDDLHNATCAHWIKGKFSLIVWFRSISRLGELKRKYVNTTHQNKICFGYSLVVGEVTLGESFTLKLATPASFYQNCLFLHGVPNTEYQRSFSYFFTLVL